MLKQEDNQKKEKFEITKFIKLKLSDLGSIALTKKKAKKLKNKIRKMAGVPKWYWDHTKNYSKEQKVKEDKYVKDRVKKHNLESFLQHYRKKPTFNLYLKKIVKEFTKKEPITEKNRHNLWLIFSGAAANIKKNEGYYDFLENSCNDSKKHFDRIINMDVKRTKAAADNPAHYAALVRVLSNVGKRNARIGYCQGMNMIASFFLENGFTEEETFWVMVYIVEDEMPSEYYTNMLSVIADLKILQLLLKTRNKSLHKHFHSVGVDIVMVALPCFITIFTNTNSRLVQIVMDNFFIDGAVVLLKTMLLYFDYLKKDLMKINDMPEIISFFEKNLKGDLVTPEKLDADLKALYISRYLVEELRGYFTEKERAILEGQKKASKVVVGVEECESHWPICYEILYKRVPHSRRPSFHVHRTSSILDNFKAGHFHNKRKYDKRAVDKIAVNDSLKDSAKTVEDQLLMIRQRHFCKFADTPQNLSKKFNLKRAAMNSDIEIFDNERKESFYHNNSSSSGDEHISLKEKLKFPRVDNEKFGIGGYSPSMEMNKRHSSSLSNYSKELSNSMTNSSQTFMDNPQIGSIIINNGKGLIRGIEEERTHIMYGSPKDEFKPKPRKLSSNANFDTKLEKFITNEMESLDEKTSIPNINTDIPKVEVIRVRKDELKHKPLLLVDEEDEEESEYNHDNAASNNLVKGPQSFVHRVSVFERNLDTIGGTEHSDFRQSLRVFLNRVNNIYD